MDISQQICIGIFFVDLKGQRPDVEINKILRASNLTVSCVCETKTWEKASSGFLKVMSWML